MQDGLSTSENKLDAILSKYSGIEADLALMGYELWRHRLHSDYHNITSLVPQVDHDSTRVHARSKDGVQVACGSNVAC